MRKAFVMFGAMMLTATAAHAQTATISDPTGDFLSSYTFAQSPDLDVTSFTVSYNPSTAIFTVSATMAGPIIAGTPGLYVIGVNNGTATNSPFAPIGQPNVAFNQAFQVQKNGTAALGMTALAATVSGNAFSVIVPLSVLNQSSFAPASYGFNLWPRIGTGGGNAQITDFSPSNALLAANAVPEPTSWALMISGFAMLGGALRKRRTVTARASLQSFASA